MKRHSKKNDIAALLKNKKVLYVVLFLAVANLFSYLMLKKLDAVAFFIIIGFLTTYFSKNMIVVLLTAVVSTFILVQINLLGHVQEGMTGATETDASGNPVATKPASAAGTSAAGTSAAGTSAASTSAPAAAVAGGAIDGATRATITSATDSTMKAPEKFTQQLNPARYNGADDDDTPRHKPKIDYAGTLESAYDNLDKLLSSDAIRNMTEDTGRLAEKQKLLMGNIEKIQPVMDKAKGILEGFDMTKINKLIGSMGNMGGLVEKKEGSAAPAKIVGE
jgi:hypothetical protein